MAVESVNRFFENVYRQGALSPNLVRDFKVVAAIGILSFSTAMAYQMVQLLKKIPVGDKPNDSALLKYGRQVTLIAAGAFTAIATGGHLSLGMAHAFNNIGYLKVIGTAAAILGFASSAVSCYNEP